MAKQWRIIKWLRDWWLSTDLIDKLLFLVLLVMVSRPLTDPDFGWQLRSGLDLLRTLHIPKFDPYAYTMPNYPWVNHEWLSEGILAFIYQYLGAEALALIFALIIIGAFWLAVSRVNADYKSKFIATALAILAAMARWGVRMQMLTILGVALVLWSFYRYRKGEIKSLWWYVPIFGLWANLHGGFLMGLGILVLIFIVEEVKWWLHTNYPRIAKHWKDPEPTLQLNQLKHLFWVGLASGAITLVNPYGWKLYQEFYAVFTNSFALKHIVEWQPLPLFDASGQWFLPYLILLALVLIFTYRKIEPTRLVIALVLLVLAFISRRNLPFFLLMSVGFLAEAINHQVVLITNYLMRYRWLVVLIVGMVSYFIISNLIWLTKDAGNLTIISALKGYPLQAVQWAKAHPDQLGSHMYNPYDWGGFLVWQFPEQKVFIDGRMSCWRIGNRFVFRDSMSIMFAGAGALQGMQDRYGVDWVLTHSNLPLAQALSNQPDWQLIYSDPIAVIYRKK